MSVSSTGDFSEPEKSKNRCPMSMSVKPIDKTIKNPVPPIFPMRRL
jgi:hypothetical protein